MWLIDQLVEQRIAEARERGDFDDLPGAGKPLVLDDDRLIAEHLRAGYRLLRNAGYLPPELHDLREIKQVEDLLRCLPVSDGVGRARAQRRLQLLRLRLAHRRRGDGGPLWAQEVAYTQKVIDRLETEPSP